MIAGRSALHPSGEELAVGGVVRETRGGGFEWGGKDSAALERTPLPFLAFH
jgi:hypothetical protein